MSARASTRRSSASPGGLTDTRSGDLGARVVGDVELLEVFFAHTLGQTIVAVTVPFAAVVLLALCHWSLPLVLIPALVLVATVPRWMQQRSLRQGTALRAATGDLSADLIDGVQGLREVVVFDHGDAQLARLDASSRTLPRAQQAHVRRAGIEHVAVDAAVSIGMLVVLLTAGALTAAGAMNAAVFPAAVVLAAFTFVPIANISEVARELGVVAAAADRVHQLLDTPAPVADEGTLTLIGGHVADTAIGFDDGQFRYGSHLPDALTDVTLAIAGESMRWSGPAEPAKSTTANLLMRFWDPTAGRITVGGIDVRDLRRDALRPDHVRAAGQHLFHTTLRQPATRTPRCLRRNWPERWSSRCHVDRRALPDGLDTIVGERRDAVGRPASTHRARQGVAAHSPILVLDEPVSTSTPERAAAGRDRHHPRGARRRDRPPALDDPHRRSHHRAGPRPARRQHPRRVARRQRLLHDLVAAHSRVLRNAPSRRPNGRNLSVSTTAGTSDGPVERRPVPGHRAAIAAYEQTGRHGLRGRGTQLRLRGRGTQLRLRGRGTQLRLRGRGTQLRLRGRGTQLRLRGRGTQLRLRGRGTQTRPAWPWNAVKHSDGR